MGKHEWHEVNFTESTFTENAVGTHSIILLVIAAEVGDESVSRSGEYRKTYTKCLMVVPTPSF